MASSTLIMINKYLYIISFVFFGFINSYEVFGIDTRVATQDVSLQVAGSALLAVTGPPVVMKMAGASEAGDEISQAIENSDSRLRISSLVSGEEVRAISAKISEALVGTQLYVELQTPNSNFGNPEMMGTLKGIRLMSNELEEMLVEGIGTCWSGKMDGDGYVIRYSFKAIPGAPIMKSANITITYTISLVPSDASE
jgi:hypothetical protein